MNSPQIFQAIFLGQDENHGVVAVPATWVNWNGCWLVNHHKISVHMNYVDFLCSHRHLMPVDNVSKLVIGLQLAINRSGHTYLIFLLPFDS